MPERTKLGCVVGEAVGGFVSVKRTELGNTEGEADDNAVDG